MSSTHLADTRVANEQELEEVVVAFGHRVGCRVAADVQITLRRRVQEVQPGRRGVEVKVRRLDVTQGGSSIQRQGCTQRAALVELCDDWVGTDGTAYPVDTALSA